MIKWHKIERINQRLSVIYSKDSQYKITIFRYTSPTSYRISISKGDSFPIMWYSGVDKWRLLSHAKKRLDAYLKIKNATISKKPKTEAKAMTKTKSKRGGRKSTTWIKKSNSTTQKMARLGAKVLKLIKTAKPRIRNGKGTNTRYARKLAKNTYLYKTRKA